MNRELLSRFTETLKEALAHSVTLSLEFGSGEVTPEHIFMGIIHQPGSLSANLLSKLGFTKEGMRAKPAVRDVKPSQIPQFDNRSKALLAKAAMIASEFNHQFVGTEHVLLSLVRLHPDLLGELFPGATPDLKKIESELVKAIQRSSHLPDLSTMVDGEAAQPESLTPALDFFTIELTGPDIALDPVIGRDAEVDRVVQILSRRTKSNPLLIGEPGVGKTAIVEGLARRIREGDVPHALRDRRIFHLELGTILAGTMYRGEFEARMRQVIEELHANPEFILFIDEIHTISNTGNAQGAIDAANLLKPALARGEVHCIGATTLDEYQKTIETDKALNRRFQVVTVEEPSVEETLQILRGLRSEYEGYHHASITDEALEEAARLSARYVYDNQMPDKAIDALDEAAALCRLEAEELPEVATLEALGDQLMRASKALQEYQADGNTTRVRTEKTRIKTLNEEIERVERALEKKERATRKITGEHVARVISSMTGVPVKELLATDLEAAARLSDELEQYIFGQNEAIARVTAAVKRARLGIRDASRPVASFLFMGPSGVGKTELAKTIARTIYGDEKALIRVDMSEFRESFNMSKLLGAPAGYVGYKEQTSFTDRVRRRPHAVVLFDEVEKAHPDVLNILLQLLEEGSMTDAAGRTIPFRDAIIVLTSNIGTGQLGREGLGFGSGELSQDQARMSALRALDDAFRPEILNRLDATVVFRSLTCDAALKIVERQLSELQDRLKNKNVRLTSTKQARQLLAARGISPKQGARAIRRMIETHVEGPVVDAMLEKNPPSRFRLTTEKGSVVVKRA